MRSTRRIARTYYLIVSLFWLATAIPLPLMVLLHQERGMNLAQIGLLVGTYSLTVVLLEVPTGGLADAVGRKRVAMLAYSFMLATGVVFFFARAFPVFALAWVLAGIGRALSSGSLDAWFVDALQEADPDVDLQPALARAGTFSLLALGAGTLLGGFIPRLFDWLPEGGSPILTPLSTTLVAAAFVNVALLAALAWLVDEERPESASDDWRAGFQQVPIVTREALKLTRSNSTIVLLLGGSLALGMALNSIETLWQPHFASLLGGADGRTIVFGGLMAGNFLLGAGGNVLSIAMARLFQGRHARMAGVLIAAAGLALALMGVQRSLLPAVGLFWLIYLIFGALNSPQLTLANQEIPAARRSSMLSVFSMVGYVGGFLGSAGLGLVAERASISSAWLVAGSLLMVSCLLYLKIDLRQGSQAGSDEAKKQVFETG